MHRGGAFRGLWRVEIKDGERSGYCGCTVKYAGDLRSGCRENAGRNEKVKKLNSREREREESMWRLQYLLSTAVVFYYWYMYIVMVIQISYATAKQEDSEEEEEEEEESYSNIN